MREAARGMVVVVGVAWKTSILIVEFGRDRQQEGAFRFVAGCGRHSRGAADYHDVLRVHPRRAPTAPRLGSRWRDAPDPWDRSLRRHDRGAARLPPGSPPAAETRGPTEIRVAGMSRMTNSSVNCPRSLHRSGACGFGRS